MVALLPSYVLSYSLYYHRVFTSSYYSTESEAGIFRQILRGKIDFESEPWPNISESAKDLIKKMLERDPRSRISAHEVLCELSITLSLELLYASCTDSVLSML